MIGRSFYMTTSWKHLLPTDTFIVKVNGILHEFDKKVLTLLYQPIIGASAYSLYMTLWGMLNVKSYVTKPHSHHYLMLMSSQTLPDIYHDRLKLEGLGLLHVYQKKDEEKRVFIYELCPPLSPQAFFKEEWLAAYLFNRLGKTQFQMIKRQFQMHKIPKDGYEDITKSFPEVFTNVMESELVLSDDTKAIMEDERYELVDRVEPGVEYEEESFFHLDLCLEMIPDVIVPKEWLTEEIRDSIWKLATIYHLNEQQMSEMIQQVCLHQESFPIDLLRTEIAAWYQINIQEKLPFLTLRHQPENLKEMKKEEVVTQKQKIVHQFETLSPYDVLRSYANGGKPALVDLKLIETIMFEQKLTPGVVNVLIDYVLKTNDGKLPGPLVTKIAAHWSRKKIKTVQEAIDFAQQEHNKSKKWQKNSNMPSVKKGRKVEKMGDWMSEKDTEVDEETWKQQKQLLEERIKNL